MYTRLFDFDPTAIFKQLFPHEIIVRSLRSSPTSIVSTTKFDTLKSIFLILPIREALKNRVLDFPHDVNTSLDEFLSSA